MLEDDNPKKRSVKRKRASVIQNAYDVELDVLDIETFTRKRVAGRRILENVHSIPLDNLYFHSEESVVKWKYVFRWRIALQRELVPEVLDCKEIMDLIADAGLMRTITELVPLFISVLASFR